MKLNSRLFLYFFSIFAVVILAISFFQYKREKQFRTVQLDQLLTTYNQTINRFVELNEYDWVKLHSLLEVFPDSNLRVTIINYDGYVLYDSYVKDVSTMENHLNRPEIITAKQSNGKGVSIRKSASTNMEFYFLAHVFDQYIVRSALPYNLNLTSLLSVNMVFLWFMFIVLIVTTIILYAISKNITRSVDKLQFFLNSAENDRFVDIDIDFPNDELGQISKNIVKTYKKLWETKLQVKREREKLIQHLQISQEGLGIFSSEKKEILLNSHFVLYAKMLTDKSPELIDELFYIPEFKEINDFIDKCIQTKMQGRKRVVIEKGGRVFIVQCIVFKDATFEISINDNTIQEQENRLKRHLTQNISHELRTPVSSILGYMESILSNPDLPNERKHFFIERSYQQAQRLTDLLQDISKLNKIDESSNFFPKEELDLASVVKDVLNDVHLELEARGIKVENLLQEFMMMKGSKSLLYSIFRNLIDNTMAYAGNNISIEIKNYREDEQFYYISFSDNGIGVAEEHLSRIFERFYRVDKGRSRKMGGTGLGLAIVKNAVIFHGGQITARNMLTGGLKFIFSLRKE